MFTISSFFFFFIFSLVFQSTWRMSTAQLSPPGGESGIERSFTVLPILIAGGFFVTGIVFVTFRRQLGACFFGIGGAGGGHIVGSGRVPGGLTQEAIEGFPTYFYEDVKVHRGVDDELECAVCLTQFQDHQVLRLMPKCNHIFHPECIDPWLHSQATCAVCRKILDPSINTPTTPIRSLISTQIDVSEDHAIPMDPISPVKSPSHQGPDHIGPIEPESTTTSTIDEPKSGDKFTLKLPEEARSKLESTLWRFAKASSGKKPYRSKTPDPGRIVLNQLWCEPERASLNGVNRSWRSFASQPASPYSSSGDGETLVTLPE